MNKEDDECDIIKITKHELNEALRQQTICNFSLYCFFQSVATFISCLFVLIGTLCVLIGKLMLDTEDDDEIEEIEYWSLLNTSWVLNAGCLCILSGFYGIFVFCDAVRPIFFSLYFWWTICSLVILITFSLILMNWKYWNWHYYLVLIPIYILEFGYILGAHRVYRTVSTLTILKNRDKMDIFERGNIKHISIGLLIAISMTIGSLMINQLSITQCEFISSSKDIVSHLVLICEWNQVEIEQNERVHVIPYHGIQQKVGSLWFSILVMSLFLSSLSFWTLWRWRDYRVSVMLFFGSTFSMFISCVLWVTMDSVCSDQQCIYYGKQSVEEEMSSIQSVVAKDIAFLNSTTLSSITCVVWCIVILIAIRTGKHQMRGASWMYARVAVSDTVSP